MFIILIAQQIFKFNKLQTKALQVQFHNCKSTELNV